jgi:uncharacterized membrane protein YwaF
MNMEWGFFGPVHIATLVAAAAILIGIYFALRKAPQKVQVWVLGVLSLSGIAAIIFNLIRWDNPINYLPLHLCSINAMMLPIAVFTRNKTIGNLLLVWSLGALVALVLNFEMTGTELFSESFNFYYFPHIFEFGIPVLLFKLGLVKKDVRCIGSTLTITMAIYTVVHIINTCINAFIPGADVNYMFSIEATNPLTELFYKLIPCQYWYMYLVLPIAAVYLLGVYTPQIRANLRQRKAKKLAAETVA